MTSGAACMEGKSLYFTTAQSILHHVGYGKKYTNIKRCWDFPGGPIVKNSLANAGDQGLIPGREDPTNWE